jgi:nucleotide-binding universal stress UspA family protein
VGIDGSEANLGAVRWAADEAMRTGARVRLVSAIVEEIRTHSDMVFSGPDIDEEIQASLARANRLLRKSVPDEGEIDTQIIVGHAAKVLARSSRDASLLVLGRRGRGTFARLLLGSVSAAAASQSVAPAVVVPSSWDPKAQWTKPIYVGVDGSARSDEAIMFAFEMAERRNVGVKAIHVFDLETVLMWAPPGVAVAPNWRKAANETLERSLAPCREKYPAVNVSLVPTSGHPVAVLVDESADAQALVIGGRAHRRPIAAALGSVALGVLAHAQGPVVVVHEHRRQ